MEKLENGTILIEAVKENQKSVFGFILTREHVLRCKESWGPRVLQECVKFGNLWATRELINIGIDCSIPDDNGSLLLHTAARDGEIELVECLLERSLNAEACITSGETAYSLARKGIDASFEQDLPDLALRYYKIMEMITRSGLPKMQGSCAEEIETDPNLQYSSDNLLPEIEFLIHQLRAVNSENNLPNWHAQIGSLYLQSHNFMEAEKHYDISCRQIPHNHGKAISDIVHTYDNCDHCKTFPIQGFRYRCGSCTMDSLDDDGYDLCRSCFICHSELHDVDHRFIQIPMETR